MITRLKYNWEINIGYGVYYIIPKLAIDADNIVQIIIDVDYTIRFERYPDYKVVYRDTAKSFQQAKRKVRKQLEKMGLVFGVEIRQPRRK